MCDTNLVGRNAIQAVRFQNALEEIIKTPHEAKKIAEKALAAEAHLCPICEVPMNTGRSHDAKEHAKVSNHPTVWSNVRRDS